MITAFIPPPPVTVTIGFATYPKPASVIVNPVIKPPATVAVAVAFTIGGGGVKTTVGGAAYPVPVLLILTPALVLIGYPRIGVAVAVVPPVGGAEIVKVGSYV